MKLESFGLCASDLHGVQGILPVSKLPVVIGHEGAGKIYEIGNDVQNLRVDDRVCVDYFVPCYNCMSCVSGQTNHCLNGKSLGFDIDGTFAEFVSVPQRNVAVIPDNIPLDQASLLGCAVVTAFHAMSIACPLPGDTGVIFGMGGVGFHAVQWAHVFGLSKIIVVDTSDRKLEISKTIGATESINALNEEPVNRVLELTDGTGADVAFDFAGLLTTEEQVIRSVRKGGKAILIGIPSGKLSLDIVNLIYNEIKIITSVDHTRDELLRVIRMVAAGRVDLSKSITHKFPLRDTNKALEVLDKKIGDPIRIVLEP